MRFLQELQQHMRLRVSADKVEVRTSYIPLLERRLTEPLIKKQSVRSCCHLY